MSANKNDVFSEPPVTESVRAHPAWFRLTNQLNWHDNNSQHWYKRLKIA
jgi:hypothetical protein